MRPYRQGAQLALLGLASLVSLGFSYSRAIAHYRMAMDPTSLTVEQEKAQTAKPGSDFKECANGCPVMIVIPAGKFMMGSPENESDRDPSEGPPHEVTIAKPFAVSRFEVTFEEWDACVAAAACPRVTDHWGRGTMPVINVSWNDAKQYVGWLSRLTGADYRLLTEAEWEYAARAGAKPVTPGAINLVQAKAIATAVEVNGTFSKRPQPDRLILTRWGYTTCTATSGSGLKIAGTRTT